MAVNDATVKFEIWDTAGQGRYYSLPPMYYRGDDAAIMVYDITNQISFLICSVASMLLALSVFLH